MNPTLSQIEDVVCGQLGVSVDEVKSKDRHAENVLARQIIFYVARRNTRLKLHAIGQRYKRDHATVMYSIQKLKHRIETDADLSEKVALILSKIPAKVESDMIVEARNILIDWKAMRNKFFNQCTIKGSDGMVRISFAPHDLFEWFKRNINCK